MTIHPYKGHAWIFYYCDVCTYIICVRASLQVLVNSPSRRIISGHYVALDLSHSIHFPGERRGEEREGVGESPFGLKINFFYYFRQTLCSGQTQLAEVVLAELSGADFFVGLYFHDFAFATSSQR